MAAYAKKPQHGGSMYTRDFTMQNALGLHARPAAMFVKTASRYKCEVNVENLENHSKVSGKSIMGLLTLGAGYEAQIRCYAKGSDAEECLDGLARLIDSKFDEE